MKMVAATDLLRQLHLKKLLPRRLQWLGIHDPQTPRWLVQLRESGSQPIDSIPSTTAFERLRQFELVCVETLSPSSGPPVQSARAPLPFVEAINFELTYDCNAGCAHCLQQGLRPKNAGLWIPTDVARKTLQDAWFAGLASRGVNLTGGEVFSAKSNLLELVEAARSLGLDVRINTNGWWGNQAPVTIGGVEFSSARRVIDWLREREVALLALSFDDRYQERPEAWHPLVSIVRECERAGQDCQLVCTGVSQERLAQGWLRLVRDAGIVPRRLIPIPMDMIDIGGAAGKTDTSFRPAPIVEAIRHSPCEGKGFFRPSFLHVAPDGGVRTCLYVPGGGWLGNVNRQSVLQIANRFSSNFVTSMFRSGDCESFAKHYFEPSAQRMYRPVWHPCGASAVFARFMEEYSQFRMRQTCEPSDEELRRIHAGIAKELNLHVPMKD